MSTKLEKVISDIEKTEKKVIELQGQLKDLYEKKTEYENVEIVNTVRALVMDKEGILEFLKTMKPAQAKALKTASLGVVKKEDDTNEND
jgi:hypothetical protein